MALKELMFQMLAHANGWFVTMMGLLNKTFLQPTQESCFEQDIIGVTDEGKPKKRIK